jgi:hypothetical protein
MKLGFLALPLGFLVLAAVVGSPAEAPGATRVADLRLSARAQQLAVSCVLRDAFDEEFRRRLDSGLPTSLVYEIELTRERRLWVDKTVGRSRLQMIVMFNALTREYLLNLKLDGELIESRVVRDQEELRKAMTTLVALPVFDLRDRSANESLRLRVRAELGTTTTFLFIPRTVHTDWVETPLFRPRDVPDAGG